VDFFSLADPLGEKNEFKTKAKEEEEKNWRCRVSDKVVVYARRIWTKKFPEESLEEEITRRSYRCG